MSDISRMITITVHLLHGSQTPCDIVSGTPKSWQGAYVWSSLDDWGGLECTGKWRADKYQKCKQCDEAFQRFAAGGEGPKELWSKQRHEPTLSTKDNVDPECQTGENPSSPATTCPRGMIDSVGCGIRKSEYDPGAHITAKELRDLGYKIPEHIPDCGWVPRWSMYLLPKSCAVVRGKDYNSCDVIFNVEFTQPFRWLKCKLKIQQ